MKKIAIIGAGASGMAAAITAARILGHDNGVRMFERNARVGKKLLSTGSGRCNLSNSNTSEAYFQNNGEGLLSQVIGSCSVEKTLEFFDNCGLKWKLTHGGRIYPYHEQASAVLDVLRFGLERFGVDLALETKIVKIVAKQEGGFKLFGETPGGDIVSECERLIIATGGKAAPKTGSDGIGFKLMTALGHNVTTVTPALAQLKTDNTLTNSLAGIRINAGLSAIAGSKVIKRVTGEVIFTAYGLSGSAALDISGTALAASGDVFVCIDFLPELNLDDVKKALVSRRSMFGDLQFEDFFTGFINKRVGQALSKQICNAKPGRKTADLTDHELSGLARLLKCYEIRLKGHTGWDNAQTSLGGLVCSEFDPLTLESLKVRGLYATGELFGFAGECGGFNLQWAWSSGITAGQAAAF